MANLFSLPEIPGYGPEPPDPEDKLAVPALPGQKKLLRALTLKPSNYRIPDQPDTLPVKPRFGNFLLGLLGGFYNAQQEGMKAEREIEAQKTQTDLEKRRVGVAEENLKLQQGMFEYEKQENKQKRAADNFKNSMDIDKKFLLPPGTSLGVMNGLDNGTVTTEQASKVIADNVGQGVADDVMEIAKALQEQDALKKGVRQPLSAFYGPAVAKKAKVLGQEDQERDLRLEILKLQADTARKQHDSYMKGEYPQEQLPDLAARTESNLLGWQNFIGNQLEVLLRGTGRQSSTVNAALAKLDPAERDQAMQSLGAPGLDPAIKTKLLSDLSYAYQQRDRNAIQLQQLYADLKRPFAYGPPKTTTPTTPAGKPQTPEFTPRVGAPTAAESAPTPGRVMIDPRTGAQMTDIGDASFGQTFGMTARALFGQATPEQRLDAYIPFVNANISDEGLAHPDFLKEIHMTEEDLSAKFGELGGDPVALRFSVMYSVLKSLDPEAAAKLKKDYDDSLKP